MCISFSRNHWDRPRSQRGKFKFARDIPVHLIHETSQPRGGGKSMIVLVDVDGAALGETNSFKRDRSVLRTDAHLLHSRLF